VCVGDAWPWRQTRFSIVNETHFRHDALFISEKTWKPLVNGHPFLLVGMPGSLALLRQLGFRTFSPIIDESYDDILDESDRMHRIAMNIVALGRMNDDVLSDALQALKPNVEHNARHFLSMSTPMHALLDEIDAILTPSAEAGGLDPCARTRPPLAHTAPRLRGQVE
jgi:hypothetical protein